MNSTAIVTIVSNNYLHFARTLLQSVARQHPDADRYCVIVDRDLTPARQLAHEFATLALEQLQLPDGDDFLFQYNILELNTAVKPWALDYLIAQGYRNILYIDPDITLYRPLTEVFAMLDAGNDLVLTPHLLAPVTDDKKPDELDIRRAGTYNLGFCAMRGNENMRAMLRWWQGKLVRDCIIAHDRGIFVDQSWMDLVPGLFANVGILRHPGYNIAYWNLAQRPVTKQDETFWVCGEALAFFHFSGLNPLSPHKVSKHQNRYTLRSVDPAVAELIDDYCSRVKHNGLETYCALPYAWQTYTDGSVVTDRERARFRVDDDLRLRAGGRPFARRDLLSLADEAQRPAAIGHADGPGVNAGHLAEVCEHFLGRQLDAATHTRIAARFRRRWQRPILTLGIGTSSEARKHPGWLRRLMGWPLRHPGANRTLHHPASRKQAPPGPHHAERASPYAGLHPPEADSARVGIWVSKRLDLPLCNLTQGKLRIRGTVDLSLLARGQDDFTFHLEIHGPFGLLHRHRLDRSGEFLIEALIPAAAFAQGQQWTILASSSIVPKEIGLSEDTRDLAWRVLEISVDQHRMIDATRSPTAYPTERLRAPLGVNLIGYLTAELGLGEAVRSLALACARSKIPYSAIDVGYQSNNLQRDTRLLEQAVQRRFPVDIRYVNADQVVTTTTYLQRRQHTARYRIGYWHWEQPELPASMQGAFAHVDEVWVPSNFVYDAVAPFSPVPVVRIPHAIEFSPSPDVSRGHFALPGDKLLVLVMYDFHSYQYRKNPQAALAAFRKAASGRRDIALVIKTINGQHHPEARRQLQSAVADLDNIIFIDDFLTRQQTWDLQSCCDILLSLHRAEGFGLAPAEMMYLGKAVVATGWSANVDFMTNANSCPVRYHLQPLTEAVGVYPAGQLWAEADIDHAAECLQRLFDDSDWRVQLGAQAAKDIRAGYSPQAIGALVARRLSMIDYWNALHHLD